MHNITHFKQITNLSKSNITLTDIKIEEKKIVLSVRWRYTTSICPHCWIKTSKRKDKQLHKQKTNIKHMPYGWDKMIELELHKRHFRCPKCNKDFYERFDFESQFWYYTTHFERYVQWNRWFTSGNKISELYQTSNSVIYSILERIDVNMLNVRGMKIIEELEEIYLWVDEHSFSGHDMVLIITELKTKQVLAVLDGITKEKLEAWIWSIPLKYHIKIKWYATDMNKWYANSLKQIIGNPLQSVDKFHLFWEANKMVFDVKEISDWALKMNFVKAGDAHTLWKKAWKIGKNITKENIQDLNNAQDKTKIEGMKKYKDKADMRIKPESLQNNPLFNSRWEETSYNEITLPYYLEKTYKLLFVKREKNLSDIEKLRLNQIFREFDYLGFLAEVWTLKEDFMDAMDNKDLKEIDRIKEDCLKSEHYRMKQFWRTLTRWYEWIKWFFTLSCDTFKFTNALTEWINNLCKVAKRQAHWFKLKTMYLKKLVARFCIKKLELS